MSRINREGNKSGIYQIRNLVNGKVYVGSAVNFKKRWRNHKKLLRSNLLKHHSPHLQRAWNKCGEEIFVFEILIHCEERLLLCYEQKYLDFFCSYEQEFGYNVCKIAGSRLGLKNSKKMKEKISGEKNYNAKLTQDQVFEIREKYFNEHCFRSKLAIEYNVDKSTISCIVLNKSWYDEKLEERNILKLQGIKNKFEANVGKTHSKKTKKKMSKSRSGNKSSSAKLTWEDVHEIRKKYSSGNFSYSDLAKTYQVHKTTIGRIVANKTWSEEMQ